MKLLVKLKEAVKTGLSFLKAKLKVKLLELQVKRILNKIEKLKDQ